MIVFPGSRSVVLAALVRRRVVRAWLRVDTTWRRVVWAILLVAWLGLLEVLLTWYSLLVLLVSRSIQIATWYLRLDGISRVLR